MTPERFEKLKAILTSRQMDLTVVMENVHKPHNLAAVARSCDAVGVFETHAISEMQDVVLRPKAASGSRKWVGVKRHGSVDEAYAHLRSKGLRILCAHFDERAVDFRSVDFTQPTAIVVGAELDGITEEAVEKADGSVLVPMLGMVKSLNVSVATALILYEAQRQRLAKGMYEERAMDDETYRTLLFEWGYPRLVPYYKKQGKPYPPMDDEGYLILEESKGGGSPLP
ncbi:tRNA (guanosine(18)-2'-O)-methyltransferase TrmH [Desulfoluna spongiiphila]|uniref:tRNA (guanosine(18)-2'-O)-methyltransferase TrmH n=1 Tax=Desulfoluna spongiiphila TaxID=419481 RepID=UPI001252D4B1|nr:tRNA (guanosine(18)-2'-O)-methyltransferase TrmH [Desulfoluna spongiiphila]VVS93125.1 trna (guanosine(18)-2'-o)-methyltransferase [Desulfoluna spongiiphila]